MTMRAESISSTVAEQSTMPSKSGVASGQPPDALQTQTEVAAAVIEEAEILHASVKAGSVAQVVVAAIAVLGLIYLLKLVLVTTLSAMLRRGWTFPTILASYRLLRLMMAIPLTCSS